MAVRDSSVLPLPSFASQMTNTPPDTNGFAKGAALLQQIRGTGGNAPIQTGLQRAQPFCNKSGARGGTPRNKWVCKGRSPFATKPAAMSKCLQPQHIFFVKMPRTASASTLLNKVPRRYHRRHYHLCCYLLSSAAYHLCIACFHFAYQAYHLKAD